MRNIATMPCRSAQHFELSWGGGSLSSHGGTGAHAKPMRIYGNRLRPLPADPKAYNHAMELAKSWRKTGLTVDLVEYYAMPGESEPGGYVLTGRVFFALHDTIERFSLPVSLFDDLLDAFTQDLSTTRY